MPEGYTGLNFGSYTFAEMVGVYFSSVNQSYFWSLALEDIWEPIQPIDTIYTSVDVVETTYTSVDSVETNYTQVL
jgi:hypothetical protein